MSSCIACSAENPEGQKFCGECGARLVDARVHEERKVITALFCDLVGSTALGERLDQEDVAHLLHDYQLICRKRIESHGGVVEKFIGDAVVGVFGVPLAHEDDPERAVRAALRIVEDVGASDLEIEVRIGVNTGEALVRLDVDPRSGEGFATGDTMNTGARLEAAAPVMGIAVGEATHRATADAIVYEELAPVAAKGKADPVDAWRAVAPFARIGTSDRDRTLFVGRDLELSMLIRLFERSRTRCSVEFVTIVAEPGLGKSRLVRELLRHVDALPELVVWREGRCLPYGDGISFWALGEIIKSQAGILESDDQATIASKLETAITEPDPQTKVWIKDRLAPLVGLETSTVPPDRTEAFTAWRRFLEQLAAEHPAVLVIEDLHWADDAFVAFLEHLAERTGGIPLLVVVTARPEVEERHPSWPPGRRSTVLSLAPLDDADLEKLVAATLEAASPELVRIVLERAGGSPLYAEQLAAMLAERALPVAGGALDESLIPSSVQALIAARIDALPSEPKRVLMGASVVGRTFWSGAVASLGDHPDLETTLGELVRRELCRPVHPSSMEGDDEFAFWHALVRDVAYAELTKADRARMHGATARWIAERAGDALGEDAEIIVHHLDAALEFAPSAPELRTGALRDLLTDALIAAGQSAMRTDVARAVLRLERSLSMMAAGDARELRAKLALAGARNAAGDLAGADEVLDEVARAARDRGDPRTETDARVERGFVGMQLGSQGMLAWKETADAAVSTFEELDDELGLAKAWRLRGWVAWDLASATDADRALTRALGHAIRAHDRREKSEALQMLSLTITWGSIPADEGLRRCDELLQESDGDRGVQASVMATRAILSGMQGDFEGARTFVNQALDTFADLGQLLYLGVTQAQECGLIERWADDLAAAERWHRKGIEQLEQIGERSFQSTALALLAETVYRQGRYAEAEELSRQSEESGDPEDVVTQAFWRSIRGKVMARKQEADAAAAMGREAATIAERSDLWIRALVYDDLAEILRLVGDVPAAVSAARRALHLYDEKGAIVCARNIRGVIAELQRSVDSEAGAGHGGTG